MLRQVVDTLGPGALPPRGLARLADSAVIPTGDEWGLEGPTPGVEVWQPRVGPLAPDEAGPGDARRGAGGCRRAAGGPAHAGGGWSGPQPTAAAWEGAEVPDEPYCRYDAPLVKALLTGLASQHYRDLGMPVQLARGCSVRYTGPHRASAGRNATSYVQPVVSGGR